MFCEDATKPLVEPPSELKVMGLDGIIALTVLAAAQANCRSCVTFTSDEGNTAACEVHPDPTSVTHVPQPITTYSISYSPGDVLIGMREGT